MENFGRQIRIMCMGCRSALRGDRIETVHDGLDAIEEAAKRWESAAEDQGVPSVQQATAKVRKPKRPAHV